MSDAAALTTKEGLARVREALAEGDVDGWLLYEFHGHNPVAASLLDVQRTTRRSFTLVPRTGPPVALIHAIERSSWRSWPWETRTYADWRGMEEALAGILEGRARVAMETSPRSAVPTLDLVPAGIIELVRDTGTEPVTSGDLVSAFHATWSAAQLRAHRKAAKAVSTVARRAFDRAAAAVRRDDPTTEGRLSRWILDALQAEGVEIDADCIVAVGSRASDPHYSPGEVGETIGRGSLLLVDLWGRISEDGVPADQTWMGYLGDRLPDRIASVWNAVRDARDAVVAFLEERHAADREVRGYEADDVARKLLRERGFGRYFVHRTGHSIDTDLHGSGPNLDNLETRDQRRLIPGVGFSIEPGVYVPDRLGVRSEINVHWSPAGPEVTPVEIQEEVFLLLDS